MKKTLIYIVVFFYLIINLVILREYIESNITTLRSRAFDFTKYIILSDSNNVLFKKITENFNTISKSQRLHCLTKFFIVNLKFIYSLLILNDFIINSILENLSRKQIISFKKYLNIQHGFISAVYVLYFVIDSFYIDTDNITGYKVLKSFSLIILTLFIILIFLYYFFNLSSRSCIFMVRFTEKNSFKFILLFFSTTLMYNFLRDNRINLLKSIISNLYSNKIYEFIEIKELKSNFKIFTLSKQNNESSYKEKLIFIISKYLINNGINAIFLTKKEEKIVIILNQDSTNKKIDIMTSYFQHKFGIDSFLNFLIVFFSIITTYTSNYSTLMHSLKQKNGFIPLLNVTINISVMKLMLFTIFNFLKKLRNSNLDGVVLEEIKKVFKDKNILIENILRNKDPLFMIEQYYSALFCGRLGGFYKILKLNYFYH